MGRHNSNTVNYFPHYIGDGKKIFSIEKKYGNDGYATWFKLLEKLAVTENHYLDLNDDGEIFYLSAKCNVDEKLLLSIISDLIKLEVFDKNLWQDKILYNQQFMDSIEDAYKRRNSKCMNYLDLCKHLYEKGIHKSYKKSKNAFKSTQSRVEESRVENIYRNFDHLSITIEEVEKIKILGYTTDQIDQILDAIENKKSKKDYVSLYLTSLNWLRRNFKDQEADHAKSQLNGNLQKDMGDIYAELRGY